MNIFSAIVNVIVAIPRLVSLFDRLIIAYNDHMISKIENKEVERIDEIRLLMSKIAQANSNDERRVLSITLSKLSK